MSSHDGQVRRKADALEQLLEHDVAIVLRCRRSLLSAKSSC